MTVVLNSSIGLHYVGPPGPQNTRLNVAGGYINDISRATVRDGCTVLVANPPLTRPPMHRRAVY